MKLIISILLAISINSFSQVSITSSPYTQNFGTSNICTFTNNVTFPGWYLGSGNYRGCADLSTPVTTATNNPGGYYAYNCSGDAKIGARASGTSPNSNLYYGVVLQNNTGSTVTSVRVNYNGYQMSLAQNGNVSNTINFDYIVGASTPSINAAAGTAVSALNFTQLQNSAVGGGNQLNWFPCTQSIAISSCINVSIPNGSFILLRWNDFDNTNNDHHMAIDDITVGFDITGTSCLAVLPIELLDFYATKNKTHNEVVWKVAQEENITHYIIEKSNDGLNFKELASVYTNNEIVTQIKTYSVIDDSPFNGITYYRLITKEINGKIETHKTIYIDNDEKNWSYTHYQNNDELVVEFKQNVPQKSTLSLFDITGKELMSSSIYDVQSKLSLKQMASGVYFVSISSPYKKEYFKIIISN